MATLKTCSMWKFYSELLDYPMLICGRICQLLFPLHVRCRAAGLTYTAVLSLRSTPQTGPCYSLRRHRRVWLHLRVSFDFEPWTSSSLLYTSCRSRIVLVCIVISWTWNVWWNASDVVTLDGAMPCLFFISYLIQVEFFDKEIQVDTGWIWPESIFRLYLCISQNHTRWSAVWTMELS